MGKPGFPSLPANSRRNVSLHRLNAGASTPRMRRVMGTYVGCSYLRIQSNSPQDESARLADLKPLTSNIEASFNHRKF